MDALVIGAGPAGLMAAGEMASAGLGVVVADAKPSFGRKLLMAGKSGLNLTRSEAAAQFARAYGTGAGPVPDLVAGFGPDAVQDWARSLGVATFTGSTGRVFPVEMKASPLLRAWLAWLGAEGVEMRTRARWTGWQNGAVRLETPAGMDLVSPRVTVLALGGASWRRLGSDGAWVPLLREAGIAVRDFAPANAGLSVAWSGHMQASFGKPVKGIALRAGGAAHRGEIVVTRTGLEGGGIYAVSRAVREGAALTLDLMPDWSVERIAARLSGARGSIGNRLRKGLGLDPVRAALLMEFSGRPVPPDAELARCVKALRVRHAGLRPLDEAISSAGGVRWDALDAGLMLHARPGTFAAGEMLDWEAPTGGYLMTACLATGRHAGRAAAAYVRGHG